MLAEQMNQGADWDYRTAKTKEYTHGITRIPLRLSRWRLGG